MHWIPKNAVIVAGIGLAAAACEHTTAPPTAEPLTTTAAEVWTDERAVHEVAKARCRRAEECDRLGNGHRFTNGGQCLNAYLNRDAPILTCSNGFDRDELTKCLAELAAQHCDADLGPVLATPYCATYCARQ
jgi:hypothetical protein